MKQNINNPFFFKKTKVLHIRVRLRESGMTPSTRIEVLVAPLPERKRVKDQKEGSG